MNQHVEEKSTTEKILQQLWVSYIKDEIDVTNTIQAKAALTYAMAAMDTIGGWHEEVDTIEGDERHERSPMGGSLAPCIWIKDSIMEAVNWVCASVQDDHDRVCGYSLVMHEKKILGELSSSAPTSLNNALVNVMVVSWKDTSKSLTWPWKHP